MSTKPIDARLTPWARNCLYAVGLTPRQIADLTPPGWYLVGHAASAQGPWTFGLVSDSNVVPLTREATVHRITDVREAIAGLLASVTPDLELQLRASLSVLGVEQ